MITISYFFSFLISMFGVFLGFPGLDVYLMQDCRKRGTYVYPSYRVVVEKKCLVSSNFHTILESTHHAWHVGVYQVNVCSRSLL
jgi:hypothetical protein